jgi:hypothetical protein
MGMISAAPRWNGTPAAYFDSIKACADAGRNPSLLGIAGIFLPLDGKTRSEKPLECFPPHRRKSYR